MDNIKRVIRVLSKSSGHPGYMLVEDVKVGTTLKEHKTGKEVTVTEVIRPLKGNANIYTKFKVEGLGGVAISSTELINKYNVVV